MTSLKKLYNWSSGVALVALGLLAWNVQSVSNNLTFGRIGRETAKDAGFSTTVIDLGGGPAQQSTYNGYVVNNGATSFIHLSDGAVGVLTWGLLVAIIALAVWSIGLYSWKYALLPGAVFLISNIIIGEGSFSYGENIFTSHMTVSVVVVTLIGVVGAFLNERYNFARKQKIPDAPPVKERSGMSAGMN